MEKEKMSKQKLRPSWWLLAILWATGAIPELVLHFYSSKAAATLWNCGVYFPVLIALVPALVLFGLAWLIGKRGVSYGIFLAWCGFFGLLCCAQLIYYEIFSTFFSAVAMLTQGEAFQFVDSILAGVWKTLPFLLLTLAPVICLAVFGLRLFVPRKEKAVWGVLPIVLAILVQVSAVAALPLFDGTGNMSAYALYHNVPDRYLSVNKLGLATSFRIDMTYVITGERPSGEIVILPPEPTEPEAPPNDEPTEPTEPVIYNQLEIDFDSLIANSTDSQIKLLHQYFQSQSATAQNEYTGIFEGCNLVFIIAESFSTQIITPERTPTLYKMMSEGMYFSNYYVPYWDHSTCDGEYALLTGTLPKKGTIAFQESINNAMPLTLSKQLLAEGYGAYAYHGHTYSYYKRNKYLANLGFNYKGRGGGLDVKNQWPASDVEVVDKSTGFYATKEPFFTYYMTISGHLEYNFSGNNMCYKNRKLVQNEPFSTAVRAYIACQLEFENSMTLLLERLEKAGTLENTVFVISTDHYPYGLTTKEYSELFGHTLEENFELYKNGLIIYKPGMTPQVVDELCYSIDVLPTLSNMFGLEFDSRLYMGRDIFSEKSPLVVFNNSSWITDRGSYNAITGEVIANDGGTLPQDYVDRINNEVSNRFAVSTRILDYDYWRALFK